MNSSLLAWLTYLAFSSFLCCFALVVITVLENTCDSQLKSRPSDGLKPKP